MSQVNCLHILQVNTGVFPIPPSRGGAVERHLFLLLRGLVRRGIGVTIVSDISPEFDLDSVRVYKIHGIRNSFNRGFYGWLGAFCLAGLQLDLAVLRAIHSERNRISIIHLHDVFSGLLLVFLKKIRYVSCPIAFTLHGYPISVNSLRYSGLKRLIMIVASIFISFVARNCDKVIVFTRTHRSQAMRAYRAPPDRFVVIPQIVDTKVSLASTYSKFKYVSYVGRLSSLKGVNFLLKALAGTGLRCRIVGDGPERVTLTELANNLELSPYVKFLGELPHSEVLQEYSRASAFVLPTLAEGFPLVLLEAMAAGLPVIASAVSGIDEVLLECRCGIPVRRMDIESIKTALLTLRRNKSLRRALGRSARKAVLKNNDIDSVAAKHVELYQMLGVGLSKKSPRE